MNQENKDVSAYVQMPRLDISPETEWYLKNTSYLALVEEIETATDLLKDTVRELRKAYPGQTHGLIFNIEQFLNKRK